MHKLVSSADELQIVVPHELGCDLGPEEPACSSGGNRPVVHLNIRTDHVTGHST